MVRQTSIEAYEKIKEDGLLTEARFIVYDVLYKYGPLTAGEIFLWMKKNHTGHTIVKGSVCARLTELRDCGVVKEVDKRGCRLTGHTALVWDVTDSLPSTFEEKESELKMLRRLVKRQYQIILELRRKLGMKLRIRR